MTIDQLKADLLLVVAIGNYIVSALSALGDSVSESELADLLSKVPEVRLHLENCAKDTTDVSNVSEDDAESIIGIKKDILSLVAKAKEIILQKKDAFAQLPNTFSTDGLFPTDAGVTVVRLLSAQFEGVRALVMNVSDAIILVAPTSNHTEKVKGIKDELHSHFHEVITAYSS